MAKLTRLQEALLAHLKNLRNLTLEDIPPIMLALMKEEHQSKFAQFLIENHQPTFEEIWMKIIEINPSIKVDQ